MDSTDILRTAKAQIRAEAQVLMEIADQLEENFIDVVQLVSECEGVILTTGSGTSGTMARRLAHLLSSCGMRAFYLQPGESLHGPSAAVGSGDVLIAFSKAGKSSDLNQLASIARQRGAKVVSFTWEFDSELARLSDVVIIIRPDVSGEGEGVLPFGSSLANGVVGDALCLIAKRLRKFDLAEMKLTHPSGGTSELV
jgi:D-arabinose 5-phosphate isomerase GutQ